MTLANAIAILYGPAPKREVDIVCDDYTSEVRFLSDRELSELLATETKPCSIYVDGLLVRRVKR